MADAARAAAVIREGLDAGMDGAVIQAHVIAPAMVAIGDLWQGGAISVADEHLATAISHSCVAQLYSSLITGEPPRSATVLVSAVEGEQHVLGARMAADVLEGAGYRTLFLGADVPTSALGLAAVGHGADVVCLSLYMPLGVPRLEYAIAVVQEARPTARIVLAGRGVPRRLRAVFPYCDSTDQLLRVVGEAIASPEQPAIVNVRGPAARATPGAAPDPVEARLSRATAQTADVARENARDADRFRRLALEDPLTGLPNRRAYEEQLEQLGANEPLLLMIDVDGFKHVNDALGHDEGDKALQRVAEAIRRSLRPTDFAARIGGDEFAVLLPNVSSYEAVCVADRLRSAVENDEVEPSLTLSIGISQVDSDTRGAMLAADQALYAAKRSGRNAVQLAQSV